MSFSFANPLKELQIELSTVCNALCLGCVRTDQKTFKNTKKYIPKNKYLAVELLAKRIAEYTQLETIEFCGNIDEPLMHPHFLDLLNELSELQHIQKISIHTNGSAKNPEYFVELANLLKKFKKHKIRFSIDGLHDTNVIYRQQTSFTKIINNAESFLKAGGLADWQFILFPWNKHEVDEARKMAESMGFERFLLRKDRSIDEATLVRIKESQKLSKSYTLQNSKGFSIEQFKQYDSLAIDCYFKKFNMMFISWDGRLWPCCFTSNIYHDSNSDKIDSYEKNFYSDQDTDFNNLNIYTIAQILENPVYKERLVKGWSGSIEDKQNPKLWRCVEKCRVSLPEKKHLEQTELQEK